jgi:hypothetical protein
MAAGQVYSGKKYALFIGRQTHAGTQVNMGTAGAVDAEFMNFDVVTITDIDFAGGLVTDRTLRTGQQVKKRTDHYVSEKGAAKTFSFEWVCSHSQGLKLLCELISEGTATPYGVAGNFAPKNYITGVAADADTGHLATVVIKNLDSDGQDNQDRVMHSAALTNLSFNFDSASNGGRLIVSGTFYSGFTVATTGTSIAEATAETRFVPTIYDFTTKTVDGLDVVLKSFNMNVSYPCIRIGHDSNGNAEAYSRSGEYTVDGSISVLYDGNSDVFLSTMLTDPGASAANLAPIVMSDHTSAFADGDFGMEVAQAVLTGHNLNMEGAEEGMFVELGYEGTATDAENLYRVDIGS